MQEMKTWSLAVDVVSCRGRAAQVGSSEMSILSQCQGKRGQRVQQRPVRWSILVRPVPGHDCLGRQGEAGQTRVKAMWAQVVLGHGRVVM